LLRLRLWIAGGNSHVAGSGILGKLFKVNSTAMTLSYPFLLIFLIVAILSLAGLLIRFTGILAGKPRQRRILLFTIDIVASSTIFFLVMAHAKSGTAVWVIGMTLAYLAVIFGKAWWFARTR
jgi:hypothetical protein